MPRHFLFRGVVVGCMMPLAALRAAPAQPLAPTAAAGHANVVAPVPLTPQERRASARRLARSPVFVVHDIGNGGSQLSFRNRLHAPVTVELTQGWAHDVRLTLLSPLRFVIKPLATHSVAHATGTNPLIAGQAEFKYSAVVGDPAAVHDDDVVYAWPFPAGAAARLSQGFGGSTHSDLHSCFAIDLAVAEGTPVLASRAGVVVFLEERYFESGLNMAKFRQKSNQVLVLHDDGSMASYGHLFPESIDLEPGQRVEPGQQIGLSGNTGYSSGPHLHFVLMVMRDMRMVSIPFRMRGLDLPRNPGTPRACEP